MTERMAAPSARTISAQVRLGVVVSIGIVGFLKFP